LQATPQEGMMVEVIKDNINYLMATIDGPPDTPYAVCFFIS
jgi:ubiquitin-protein ligase